MHSYRSRTALKSVAKQWADSEAEFFSTAAPDSCALQALTNDEKPPQVVCNTPSACRATGWLVSARMARIFANCARATSGLRQGHVTTSKPLLAKIRAV